MTLRGPIRLIGAIALGACAFGVLDAQARPQAAVRPRTLAEDLQLFSQVLNQIRVNHPDSMDSHAMFMAAIEGMIRATDPHSYVVPAVRLDSARQRALEDGKLAPVPIAFQYSGGVPSVVSVAPGSDAAKRNILPGDELLAVDGEALTAESEDELSLALAGTKGSTVTLKLLRRHLDGSTTTLDRVVKRERAEETTAVPVSQMLDSATGYVRISTFANSKVADDMHDAVDRLEKSGMKRLLLDLRDNGGGLVTQASDASGEFLPKGVVIYTSSGRKEAVNKTVKVSRSFWRRERGYPVVVLVNRGTASASELFAGALQDHDRALIVGRPTFGKALLMQGMPLTDGSYMMLVVGHVKTPCGRVVQRQYRGVRESDYRRGADAERDTVGRPSCKTSAGRTVYGGGGIYPDVMLDHPAPTPVWLRRLHEDGTTLRWATAAVAQPGRAPTVPEPYLDGSVISPAVLSEFRTFARERKLDVPDGADVDLLLKRELSAELARAKLGEAAYYRVMLRDDAWVKQAMLAFERAALLKGPSAP